MNHNRTLTTAAVLTALTLATGCSSSSTAVATNSGAGTTAATTPASADRTSAAAVAAAFAADYAGGSTPAACALTTGAAMKKMSDEGLCQQQMSWREIPTQIVACPIVNGQARFVYQVDHEIQRFLLFGIKLVNTAGVWSVTQLGGHTPGDGDYGCPVSSSSTGGG